MLTTDIPVDRSQQLGQLLGADARVVPSLVGFQNIGRFDLRDRIVLREVVGDRIAHDLAAVLQHAFGNIECAALLDLAHDISKGRGR